MLNKNILIYGLGISGISAVKAFGFLGKKVTVYDRKSKEELSKTLDEIKNIEFTLLCGENELNLNNYDIIIKSPGIHPNDSIVKEAEKMNIKIISDVEAAYLLKNSNIFIGITGTNGKTTTTSLISAMFEEANRKYIVTGNIGSGIMYDTVKLDNDAVIIAELSSFQLEYSYNFKPDIYVITNISEDHIDWHGSYDAYIEAKIKIVKRMLKNSICIINYDDKILRKKIHREKTNIVFFSYEDVLEEGIYLENNIIKIKKGNNVISLINKEDIFIRGKHNIENAMAAAYAAYLSNIESNLISKALKEFKGVEHRLEFVAEIENRKYYNDSKGTNVEASLKAISSFDEPIILIAGGYDKSADFDEFTKTFYGKIKKVLLLGETANIIKNSCISNNFYDFEMVVNLEEAIIKGTKISHEGDVILLSPACASWDMYKNYEERGNEFKKIVYIMEKNNEGKKIH